MTTTSEVLTPAMRSRLETRLSVLDLPPRYQAASMNDFPPSFADLVGSSAFITGGPGVGKTHLAAALAKAQVHLNLEQPTSFAVGRDRCFARFITAPELMAKFRMAIRMPDVTEDDLMHEYANCEWLYLDDLGVEQHTDWTFQTIYRIIDYRYAHMLPMVITSNISLVEMAGEQSRRIASRLVGSCAVIDLGSKDLRGAR